MTKIEIIKKLKEILRNFFKLDDLIIDKYINNFEKKDLKEEYPINFLPYTTWYSTEDIEKFLSEIINSKYESKVYELLLNVNYNCLAKIMGYKEPDDEFFEILETKYNINTELHKSFHLLGKTIYFSKHYTHKCIINYLKTGNKEEKKELIKPLLTEYLPKNVYSIDETLEKIKDTKYENRIIEILFYINFEELAKAMGYKKPDNKYFEIMKTKYNVDMTIWISIYLQKLYHSNKINNENILNDIIEIESLSNKLENLDIKYSNIFNWKYYLKEEKFESEFSFENGELIIVSILYSINDSKEKGKKYLKLFKEKYIEFIRNTVLKDNNIGNILYDYISGKRDIDIKKLYELISENQLFFGKEDDKYILHEKWEDCRSCIQILFTSSVKEINRMINILLINEYIYQDYRYDNELIKKMIPFSKWLYNKNPQEKFKFYQDYFSEQNFPEEYFIFKVLQDKSIIEDKQDLTEYIKTYFEKKDNETYELSETGKKLFDYYIKNFDPPKKNILNEIYKKIKKKYFNAVLYVNDFKNEYSKYLIKRVDLTEEEKDKVIDYFDGKTNKLPKKSSDWTSYSNFEYHDIILEKLENNNIEYFNKYLDFEMKIRKKTIYDVLPEKDYYQPIENYSKYGFKKNKLTEIAFTYYKDNKSWENHTKSSVLSKEYFKQLDKIEFYKGAEKYLKKFSIEAKERFFKDYVKDIKMLGIFFDNMKSKEDLKRILLYRIKKFNKKEIIELLKNKLTNKSEVIVKDAINILYEINAENLKEILEERLKVEKSEVIKEEIKSYLNKIFIHPELRKYLSEYLTTENIRAINKLGNYLLPLKDNDDHKLPIEYSIVLISSFTNNYDTKDAKKKQKNLEQYVDKKSIINLADSTYSWFKSTEFESNENNIQIGKFGIVNASLEKIEEIKKDIEKLCRNSKGKMAATIYSTLTWNDLAWKNDNLLRFADYAIRKLRSKPLKESIEDHLKMVAKNRKIEVEDLLKNLSIENREISNYGLDKYGSKIYSYGDREFKIKLLDKAEFEIIDMEKNKILKSLPKTTDDETKAEKAREEFKLMKKEIKSNYKYWLKEVEQLWLTDKKYEKSIFEKTYIVNPVMREFGMNLIWGTYNKENNLIESFRYTEDGTITTSDERDIELKETDIIGLVHPIELNEEILTNWKEQLENYEIIQPFEQINRTIYSNKKEYKGKKSIEVVINNLLKNDWKRGEVLDHGIFYEYFYKNIKENIMVRIKHSGIKIREYENKEIKIEEVNFYRIKTDKKIEEIKEIPNIFYSEIRRQLEEVIF